MGSHDVPACAAVGSSSQEAPIRRSETLFATTPDGTRVAYQVLGGGPGNLIYIPPWVSHVELNWGDPPRAAFLRDLADAARVIVFDKRGTGLSDRPRAGPDLERLIEDIEAVMGACEIERAVLFGLSSGAAMSALFAATYPHRVRGLVMGTPKARARWAADYPWGTSTEEFEKELSLIRAGWDSGEFVRTYAVPIFTPSRAGNQDLVERLVSYTRQACTMEEALALSEMWWDIDYRGILTSISVPTLVIGPPGHADEIAYVAGRIPGAKQLVVPEEAAFEWTGETGAAVEAVRQFVEDIADEEAEFDRVLATVLFTDIVNSTKHAAAMGDRKWIATRNEHDRIVRSHLVRFRGREVKTMGDGFLATFDGPARAVRCSLALVEGVRQLGVEIRAGLHTGEVTFVDGDVSGITVATGARVMAAAGTSEVLVSQTVRDLVAGSGLVFEDAGDHTLKGVPGRWHLHRAVRDHADRPRLEMPQASR